MAAYFISDLHLTPARSAVNQLFVDFTARVPESGDTLYVLGDLFDYWAGDDDLDTPLGRSAAAALAAVATRGVGLYFLPGNRDFLIGAAFCEAARLTLLADNTAFDLHGARTVLLHGDTLCTDDRAYQQFRATVRSREWRDAFLARPAPERRSEIEALRAKSETEKAAKPDAIMDVNAVAVQTLFRESNAARMIHGHTHRPAAHDYLMFGRAGVRWVLPAWDQRAGYLRVDERGDVLTYLEP